MNTYSDSRLTSQLCLAFISHSREHVCSHRRWVWSLHLMLEEQAADSSASHHCHMASCPWQVRAGSQNSSSKRWSKQRAGRKHSQLREQQGLNLSLQPACWRSLQVQGAPVIWCTMTWLKHENLQNLQFVLWLILWRIKEAGLMFGISRVSAVSCSAGGYPMLNSTSSVNPHVFQSTYLYRGVWQMHFFKAFYPAIFPLFVLFCHYNEEIKWATAPACLWNAFLHGTVSRDFGNSSLVQNT